MEKLKNVLAQAFGAELSDEPFRPCAIYYDCMDYIEYLSKDATYVAERVDEYLTVLWDSSKANLVGFRIKGFKFIFNKQLKLFYDLGDKDFLPMISVIQAIIERIGHELVGNEKREKMYRQVIHFAKQQNIEISDIPYDQKAA